MCGQYFVSNPSRIGEGVVVEIDETVLTRRKYNRGALRAEQQWVFGGVERGTGRCFLWPVERRDAQTLLRLIQNFILPGSTIMSDLWAAYNHIDQLPEVYQHFTVNHRCVYNDRSEYLIDETCFKRAFRRSRVGCSHADDREHMELFQEKAP